MNSVLELPDNRITTTHELIALRGETIYAVKNFPETPCVEITSIEVGPLVGYGNIYLHGASRNLQRITSDSDLAVLRNVSVVDLSTADGEIVRGHLIRLYGVESLSYGYSSLFRTKKEAENWAIMIKMMIDGNDRDNSSRWDWLYGWTETYVIQHVRDAFL